MVHGTHPTQTSLHPFNRKAIRRNALLASALLRYNEQNTQALTLKVFPPMAYVTPETLEERDTALVYVAGKTSEAKAVEGLLTQSEMTYTIKPTPFLRSSLFGGLVELPGLGFYVPSEQPALCRNALQDHKLKADLVLEGEE